MNSLIANKNGVQVSWYSVSNADKYYIYRQVDGEKSWKEIAELDTDNVKKDQYGNLIYIDKTAKNNTTYCYIVKAYDNGTFSGYVKNRYFTYYDPIDITYAKATSDGIKLKWEKALGADGYNILRKEKDSDSYSFVTITMGKDGLSGIDSDVKPGTTYTYAVIARSYLNNGKDGSSDIGGTKNVTAK